MSSWFYGAVKNYFDLDRTQGYFLIHAVRECSFFMDVEALKTPFYASICHKHDRPTTHATARTELICRQKACPPPG